VLDEKPRLLTALPAAHSSRSPRTRFRTLAAALTVAGAAAVLLSRRFRAKPALGSAPLYGVDRLLGYWPSTARPASTAISWGAASRHRRLIHVMGAAGIGLRRSCLRLSMDYGWCSSSPGSARGKTRHRAGSSSTAAHGGWESFGGRRPHGRLGPNRRPPLICSSAFRSAVSKPARNRPQWYDGPRAGAREGSAGRHRCPGPFLVARPAAVYLRGGGNGGLRHGGHGLLRIPQPAQRATPGRGRPRRPPAAH